MYEKSLEALLRAFADGTVSSEEVIARLKTLPYESIDFARPDTHRLLRQGFAEVIFAEGKTGEQIGAIAAKLLETSGSVLATRVDAEKARELSGKFPEGRYFEDACLFVFGEPESREPECDSFSVAVLSAGTSDLPVAQEAARVLEYFGVTVVRKFDVGVAGAHRLLGELSEINACRAIIVVAGMDGVLPSLVGGLVASPVVAVPTSVGYGASFEGIAPLLTMLNSCAAGVAVVNIDNGFGAAMAVLRMRQASGR
ncbi:MAG: nickel pincer cofactor biosynthesis protein LarB [Cyanobacteria bacterium HKST-UBA02]|nr:nickel pincer cofactor biosynthesis protein LarB [Cyanobacteria bacterium HKST-UBA02]